MKRMNWSIIAIIMAAILYILYLQYGGNTDEITVSTVTSGLVTDKNLEPYSVTLAIMDENELEYIDILVDNENTWNLIEANRFYFVMFYNDGNGMLELGQISNNDDFGRIHEADYHELVQKAQ